MGTTTEPHEAKSRWSAFSRSETAVYGNAFRVQRLKAFLVLADQVLDNAPVCRILDIGGEQAYWLGLEHVWRGRNLNITLVNRGAREVSEVCFDYISGDARDLSRFPDDSFDVVHSNSVIEHVGMWSDMRRMANEVRRLAPAYYVQTPNYWFPYEPHLRTPFIHWLPHPWQRRIVMSRSCGFYPRAQTLDQAHDILSDASLLDAAAMRQLFPDADIRREHLGPLTKSISAVRSGRPETE